MSLFLSLHRTFYLFTLLYGIEVSTLKVFLIISIISGYQQYYYINLLATFKGCIRSINCQVKLLLLLLYTAVTIVLKQMK